MRVRVRVGVRDRVRVRVRVAGSTCTRLSILRATTLIAAGWRPTPSVGGRPPCASDPAPAAALPAATALPPASVKARGEIGSSTWHAAPAWLGLGLARARARAS